MIKILPPRLANQIAAGEVVERPSSVVKELLENSLDAGADRVVIDIERGGHKMIRINDNGKGVVKDELQLALSRHATSKIDSLNDLEAIVSLGFRGEALASISSVSRLTFTSRTESQEQAWQAHAEGRDMAVTLNPVAHPKGTTVEVVDLFFNTPARRKFLRTEKTEFSHIDETIRRIALSRFDVQIILNHNGKEVRRYSKAMSEQQQQKRVSSVCSSGFMQHTLTVSSEHDGMKLYGWLGSADAMRKQNDIQYFYVNGRMMRDKVINHAIRQAYTDYLVEQDYPAFVLYLELPPEQVDVNVHPAKHEVRFHQTRLVHDFICQVLVSALKSEVSLLEATEPAVEYAVNDSPHQYYQPQPLKSNSGNPVTQNQPAFRSSSTVSKGYRQAHNNLMTPTPSIEPVESEQPSLGVQCTALLSDHFALLQGNSNSYLINLRALDSTMLLDYFQQDVVSQPLLMPVSLQLEAELIEIFLAREEVISQLGYQCLLNGTQLIIRQVPALLRSADHAALVIKLLEVKDSSLTQLLVEQVVAEKSYTQQQAVALIQQYPDDLTQQPALCQQIRENVWDVIFQRGLDN